jgi:2-dehydro-3-deoxygluconokinase
MVFGEAMLRLSPPGFARLEQTSAFDVVVGGSELSVGINLARLGLDVGWVTALPDLPTGRLVANAARQHGVDVTPVRWSQDGRVGIYFYETGAAPRAAQVIYDRKGSAMSLLQPGDVDWRTALYGARLFHTCGITPALSRGCRLLTLEAMKAARDMGVRCSFDLNYRSRLWTVEEARDCYQELAPYADVLFASGPALASFFGITEADPEMAARAAQGRFGIDVVVLTDRVALGMRGATVSSLAVADRTYQGRTWEVEIVDRLGAGDAYNAGFLFGYLQGNLDLAVAYAGAMAALKHTIPGEVAWVTRDDLELTLQGEGSQVRR